MAYTTDRYFSYSRGIYRTSSEIDPGYPENGMWDALNMCYDKDSDDPQTLYGNSQYGSTAMGGAVSGLFNYNEGEKLVATAEDGKFYHYTGGDWAAEGGARAASNSTTAGVRWSSAMFYGATTAATLLCSGNGVDAPTKYDGSNVTALGGSPPSTGQYPTPWQGRLWWASGSTLYGSKVDDCEVYASGSGGVELNVYRGTGDITGMAAFGTNLFIFKRQAIFRIAPTDSFTTSSVVRNVSLKVGCVSFHTIAEDDNGLSFMSEHGIQRVKGSAASQGFTLENLSRTVKSIFDWKNKAHENKSWAIYDLSRMEYWFSYPIGTTAVPTHNLIANFAGGTRWTRSDRQNLTAGAVLSGTSDTQAYYGDTNGKVWKMHDENSYTWNDASWESRVVTKFYEQGEPYRMKKYGWGYANAEAKGSYDINLTLTLIRTDLPAAPNNRENIGGKGGGGGGGGDWGVATWGGTGRVGRRVRVSGGQRGYGLQMQIDSSRWFRLLGTALASKKLSAKNAA